MFHWSPISDITQFCVFLAFRCCYCYHLNEAKKKRPFAPPIEGLSTPPVKSRFSRTSINATTLPEGPETSANPVEGMLRYIAISAIEKRGIIPSPFNGRRFKSLLIFGVIEIHL